MGSDNKPTEPATPSGGVAPKWEPDDSGSALKPVLTIGGMGCIMQLIGVAMAFAIFKFGATATYSAKMAAAAVDGQHWAFAAVAVVAFTIRFVNFFPMTYKEKVMKGALRDEIGANMRSNPFIYKGVGAGKETVLFVNEGVAGKYNRANRSLTHMIENFGSVLAGMTLAGSVFPFPTFVCACAFAAGRVMHQVGYSGGYGKHGGGFMIAMLGTLVLEGLVILVALAGFGLLAVEVPEPTVPPALEARLAVLEAALKAAAS